MRAKDVAAKYGLDPSEFATWLQTTKYKYTNSPFSGLIVSSDQDIDAIVADFAWCTEDKRRREEALREEEAKKAEEEQRILATKQQALANMLITSGFSFDGYRVAKYSGYISGDDVVQVSRGTGGWFFDNATDVGATLMEALVQMRRRALTELKEAAYALGCNAVIGVDFDYLTLEPETAGSTGGTLYLPYVFGVTANGNAVVIEKI